MGFITNKKQHGDVPGTDDVGKGLSLSCKAIMFGPLVLSPLVLDKDAELGRNLIFLNDLLRGAQQGKTLLMDTAMMCEQLWVGTARTGMLFEADLVMVALW